MGIFKRAFLYVIRKKVRSSILFIILLIMGLFMLMGLSIRSSAVNAAQDVRKSMSTGIRFQLNEIDGSKIYKLVPNDKGEMVRTLKVPLLTRSNLRQLLDIEGVQGYYTEQGHEILYTGLNVHPGGYSETNGHAREEENSADWSEEEIAVNEAYAHSNGFYLAEEGQWHPFFANGALELVEGRNIKSDDAGKGVISEELAERNGLKIGDKIESYNFDFITGERYGSPFETEIVGIFKINFQQDLSNWTSEDDILANAVFADPEMRYWAQVEFNTHIGRDVLGRESYETLDNLTLYVDDPLMLDGVKEQILAMDTVDWSYYTFKQYDDDYKAAAGPLNTMVRLSTLLIVIMAAGMLIVLSLVLTMWIRSRRREIGILTSIGVKGHTILVQLILECCLIAAVAFIFAGLLAGPLTEAGGDKLTKTISSTIAEQPFEVKINAESQKLEVNRTPDEQTELNYNIAPGMAVCVFLIMMSVIVISVMIAYFRIARLGPRDILS